MHTMNINILGKPLFCQNCFKYFQTPDRLASHLKLCQMKRNFPPVSSIKEESSGGCFSGASTSSSCSSKEKTVSPSLNFSCTICGKGFRTKDLLGKHEKTHEKNHTCQICFHSFSQKYHLVKHHELRHRRPKPNDKKPYRCVQCPNKWFTRSRGLTKHSRIHTGEKLHFCPFPFCEKKFPVKSELNSHIRTHTGEKPFKCEVCCRHFAEKSTLKTHLYTHTNTKPYSCEYCDRRFNQHSTLSGHMFTHTR